MTEHQLLPLPIVRMRSDSEHYFDVVHVADAKDYARLALAPLLEEIAAREADSAIKADNLETLREQNGKLREALEAVFDEAEYWSHFVEVDTAPMQLRPYLERAARAALGDSNE